MIDVAPENVKPHGRYTITETAKALKVCNKTVYNLINEGVLTVKYAHFNHKRYVTGQSILYIFEKESSKIINHINDVMWKNKR